MKFDQILVTLMLKTSHLILALLSSPFIILIKWQYNVICTFQVDVYFLRFF